MTRINNTTPTSEIDVDSLMEDADHEEEEESPAASTTASGHPDESPRIPENTPPSATPNATIAASRRRDDNMEARGGTGSATNETNTQAQSTSINPGSHHQSPPNGVGNRSSTLVEANSSSAQIHVRVRPLLQGRRPDMVTRSRSAPSDHSPPPPIPFTRSALSAVSIVDQIEHALQTSKTEDKSSSNDLLLFQQNHDDDDHCVQDDDSSELRMEQQQQHEEEEEGHQETIHSAPSGSTLSSSDGFIMMELERPLLSSSNPRRQPSFDDVPTVVSAPDILLHPSDSKDSAAGSAALDVVSLPDLNTNTTVDSNEPVLSSVDFGIASSSYGNSHNSNIEAEKQAAAIAAITGTSSQQQEDNNDEDPQQAQHEITGNDNNTQFNEALTIEDLNEEEELKVGRSSLDDTDTDNDSTLPPDDASSSNTVQTADEAGTDTTYDTDGSLSTASAVNLLDQDDVDEVDVDDLQQPPRTFSMVNPLMSQDEEDDESDESEMRHRRQQQEQHSIMPQQPELLVATAFSMSMGLDSVPTTSGEEEKTEVDEYPIVADQDHHHQDHQDETGSIEELAMLPEPPNVEPPELLMTSKRRIRFEDDDDVPPIIDNNRAEYVSATIIKRVVSEEHGLEFRMIDRELRLTRISETGLFANSPLAPFDRVLRINDLNCETLDPVNASHLLDVLTGSITIIAQNQGGVKDLVESLITKPRQESRTGIDFKDVCTDEELMKHDLEITRIGEKSLFSSSLLHVGDRVLAVNQCEDLNTNMADVLLTSAVDHCVILARTKLKTKMAIARRPTHQLPPNFNFVRAMEEARRHREELQRKQGCYYNSCERPGACANIFQWLGNVYVITIVIVGVSISWSTVKDQTYDESDAVGTILKFMALFVGGILLGFLVNAPWWFRRVGARFSIAQLLCNLTLIVSYFVLTRVLDISDSERLSIFLGLFFPLLIIVNLPSVFVRREDGSDGNTISDRDSSDDDMSTNSEFSDQV